MLTARTTRPQRGLRLQAFSKKRIGGDPASQTRLSWRPGDRCACHEPVRPWNQESTSVMGGRVEISTGFAPRASGRSASLGGPCCATDSWSGDGRVAFFACSCRSWQGGVECSGLRCRSQPRTCPYETCTCMGQAVCRFLCLAEFQFEFDIQSSSATLRAWWQWYCLGFLRSGRVLDAWWSNMATESEFLSLFILRHGQSVADVEGVFEGCLDSPLTEKGIEQARLAARWIAENCPPHRIISSPLQRARQTAEEVGRRVSVTVEKDHDLRERENGILAGLTREQARTRGLLRPYKPEETAPGGETLIAFRARVEVLLARLLSGRERGQRILIVTHDQMIDMLFHCFLRLPTDDSVRFVTDDTGIHCWRVAQNEHTVAFTNRRSHLELAATAAEGKCCSGLKP